MVSAESHRGSFKDKTLMVLHESLTELKLYEKKMTWSSRETLDNSIAWIQKS